MKRSLAHSPAITRTAARHPFRASLPAHVFVVEPEPVERDTAGRRFTLRDWRDFFAAYVASFVAVSAFIF